MEQEQSPLGEVIYAYTRAQAVEDGELVDVSETAREAGIKFPVALTRAAWGRCVEIPEGVTCPDEAGRLWDVLWMLRAAIVKDRLNTGETDLLYHVYVRTHNRERLDGRDLVTLKAVCGPGDTPEPVITVMLPDED